MATSKITVDEGTTTNLGTNTISEDAVTKHLSRTVLNTSAGAETGITAAPLAVALPAATVTTLTPPAAITGFATATLQGGGLPAALGAGGGLKVDGSGTALPVSVASIPSHAVTNAGTFAVQATPVGAGAPGDGTQTVTTGGTRVQLSAASVPCRRVVIQAHEDNTGTVVVGVVSCVAALAGRRGRALLNLQSEEFNVSNLNLLYIDSTADADKVNYYYE